MKTNAKIEALRKTHAAKLKQAQDIRAAEGYASLDDKSQKTEAAAQVDGLIAELDAVNGEIAVEVRLQTEADEAARAQGQPVPDPRVEEGKNELVLKDADLRNISTDEAKARKDAVFAAWGARCASGEAGERNYLAANPAAAKLVRLARAVAAADKARSLMGADATEQGIMDVVNVMTSDTATSGGEIVPTEVAAEVLRHLQVLSPVRQIADVRSLSMLATVDVGIITQTGHAAALVDEKDEGADSPAARDLPTASNLMRPQRIVTSPVLVSDTYLDASVDGAMSIIDALVDAMMQEEGVAFQSGTDDIKAYTTGIVTTALSGKTSDNVRPDLGKLMSGVNSRYQRGAGILMNETVIRGYMAAQVGTADARFSQIITKMAADDHYTLGTGDRIFEEPFLPGTFTASKLMFATLSRRGYRVHDFPLHFMVKRIEDLSTARKGAVAFLGCHYVAANVVDSKGIATFTTTA